MTKHPLDLPPAGVEVQYEDLLFLAYAYEKQDIVQMLLTNSPDTLFVSDGCSLWPDEWFKLRGFTLEKVSLYPACFWHDVRYWCGLPGDDIARLDADAELMKDVARIHSIELAELMFAGVRAGGIEELKLPFSWGYGR